MFSLFKSNGASIADGTTFTFDNEGTVKTAEMIRNMIEKGYIGHSSTGGANYEKRKRRNALPFLQRNCKV